MAVTCEVVRNAKLVELYLLNLFVRNKYEIIIIVIIIAKRMRVIHPQKSCERK